MTILARIAASAMVAVTIAAAATSAQAQTTVIVVRHAEQVTGDGSTDPGLAPAGVARAARLAEMLGAAGVKAIYTSERLRAKETAAPLAAKAGITPVEVPAADAKALVARIAKETPVGSVVVVGHSNTVPEILKLLGVPGKIEIPDGDHENLFVVVRPKRGTATVVRLRY